jgi:hypothetical protein
MFVWVVVFWARIWFLYTRSRHSSVHTCEKPCHRPYDQVVKSNSWGQFFFYHLNCFEKSFSIRMNCTMKAYRPFLKFACNYDVWIWTAHSCIYLGFKFAHVPPVCGFICCWGIQISSSVTDVVLPLLGLCIVWINFVQNCTNWTMISVQEWPNENLTPPHMRAALVGCGNFFLNILV